MFPCSAAGVAPAPPPTHAYAPSCPWAAISHTTTPGNYRQQCTVWAPTRAEGATARASSEHGGPSCARQGGVRGEREREDGRRARAASEPLRCVHGACVVVRSVQVGVVSNVLCHGRCEGSHVDRAGGLLSLHTDIRTRACTPTCASPRLPSLTPRYHNNGTRHLVAGIHRERGSKSVATNVCPSISAPPGSAQC